MWSAEHSTTFSDTNFAAMLGGFDNVSDHSKQARDRNDSQGHASELLIK
jgi:hypothetical protein